MDNTFFDDINLWNEILEEHIGITKSIVDYNERVKKGNYLQHNDELNPSTYNDLLALHIINLLTYNKELYILKNAITMLDIKESDIWKVYEKFLTLKEINTNDFVFKLTDDFFDNKIIKFIQEICTQDIVYNNKLAKDISYILSRIRTAIIMDSIGEEEVLRLVTPNKSIRCQYDTIVEKRFEREYSKWGTLIRNRVFKQKGNYKKIMDEVNIGEVNEYLLDYRYEKNACQCALLHINNEEKSSCGTGFVISSEGYALTCAHVIEGAANFEELEATIINGDGYPLRREGFEVYDSGYGKVVYSNKELDIALLKMEHFGPGYLPIEEKDILPELGEEVVVFGYPLGYEMPRSNFFGPNISFYKGYVSSNQVWNGNSVTFLDIDVKSGNSGSPVISTRTGKVIGIVSGAKVGSRFILNEKMPYMIPIQHFLKLLKKQ